MKTVNLFNILFSAILLFNCENDEVKLPEVPVCELSFSNDETNYYYGDTIVVNALVTKFSQYVNQLSLYLDNDLVFQSSKINFSYDIYTIEVGGGTHELILSVRYSQDKTTETQANIFVQSDEPVITTKEILNVGTDSATFYGTFAYTGGKINNWGFCYNKTGSPTMEENKNVANKSNFILKVTDLTKLTSYFVRTWASIDKGIIYGEELTFKTTDDSGFFIDERDNKKYRWVKIGEQIWMAENLAYLPFLSDNYSVPENDSNIWINGYYGMDLDEARELESYKTYGTLYGWGVVQDVCPVGWHLPTYDEFSELIDNLGGFEIAGNKLKERGTVHWNWLNTEATNESGFSALGSGARISELGRDGSTYFKSEAYFWVKNTDEPNISGDDYFWLGASSEKVCYMHDDTHNRGYSIRCIKNE